MEDMIKQIIEMDEHARALKEAAIKEKASSEKDIETAREKLYEDYLARARQRVKVNSEIEQQHADETWKTIRAKHEENLALLNKDYEKNKELWISQIVDRVIQES